MRLTSSKFQSILSEFTLFSSLQYMLLYQDLSCGYTNFHIMCKYSPENSVIKAVVLYCCPDYPSCPASTIQSGQPQIIITKTMDPVNMYSILYASLEKKYLSQLSLHLTRELQAETL